MRQTEFVKVCATCQPDNVNIDKSSVQTRQQKGSWWLQRHNLFPERINHHLMDACAFNACYTSLNSEAWLCLIYYRTGKGTQGQPQGDNCGCVRGQQQGRKNEKNNELFMLQKAFSYQKKFSIDSFKSCGRMLPGYMLIGISGSFYKHVCYHWCVSATSKKKKMQASYHELVEEVPPRG